MKVVLLGLPGSGKGTCAQLLEPKFKVISTGELLRKIPKTTLLGKKIDFIVSRGGLVPDDVIIKLIKNKVDSKNIIFDGFPRTLNQAEILDKKLKIDKAILLKINKNEIIKRISGRLQCIKCERVYHIKNNPPKKKGICDFCGGILYKRNDEEAIKKRLIVYEKNINPIINFYKKKNILFELNADKPIKIVFKDLEKLLNNKKK